MSLQACDFFKKKEDSKNHESVKVEDRLLATEKKVDEILKKVDEILVKLEASQKSDSEEKPLESELKKTDISPQDEHQAPEHGDKQNQEEKISTKPIPEIKTSAEKPKESPDVVYKKAMDAFKAKKFESAAGLFDEIIVYFPENDLVDNSLYWKGESLFALKKYAEAIESLKIVAEKHPDSEKAAGALLKTAYAFQAMGNKEEAINYFKKTITTYPFSQQGSIAQSMLEKPD